jgi:phosphoribosylamine--glycine ligase
MKILVVGGGGREHAIIWKLRQNPRVTEVHCAPGNGGIGDIATCVPMKATDIRGLVDYATKEQIDLVVVAPDDPLYMGLVDELQKAGIRAFGPTAAGARLEGSKAYAKSLMKKYGIPSARYEVFADFDAACAYVRRCALPVVVKADGLALGKGVVICGTVEEAKNALDDIMVKKVFGEAGRQVVIEEFLQGPEVSVLAFCDGRTILPMASAQDHKRVFDNDQGPNTGGMGTFSPSPKYTDAVRAAAEETIIRRTVDAMLSAGGYRLQGCAVFRADADEGRPEASGIQRALRGYRSASGAAAHEERPAIRNGCGYRRAAA